MEHSIVYPNIFYPLGYIGTRFPSLRSVAVKNKEIEKVFALIFLAFVWR